MKTKLVECPNSYHAGLNGGDKVHSVPQSELDANGGVCAKCRESFRKRYYSQTLRNHDTEHHDEISLVNQKGYGVERAAFAENHDGSYVIEPVAPEEVVFAADDNGDFNATGLNEYGMTVLGKFLRVLLEVGGRNRETFFEAAHAMCFAAHLHPDMELSGEEIAQKYFRTPKTKQAFFKHVNQFRDWKNLPRTAGAKSNKARQTYRKQMKASHERRKPSNSTRRAEANRFFERISAAGAAA